MQNFQCDRHLITDVDRRRTSGSRDIRTSSTNDRTGSYICRRTHEPRSSDVQNPSAKSICYLSKSFHRKVEQGFCGSPSRVKASFTTLDITPVGPVPQDENYINVKLSRHYQQYFVTSRGDTPSISTVGRDSLDLISLQLFLSPRPQLITHLLIFGSLV
jgi:hypothetical protein